MKKIQSNIIQFIFILSLSPVMLSAQDLVTDRPDQTESSVTVPKGSLQWESGFWFEKQKNETFTFPQHINTIGINSSLFRYGLFDNFELRLGADIVNTHNYQDVMGLLESISSFTDLEPIYIGFKIKLLEESGIIPEFAILGHLGIPSLSTTDIDKASPDLSLAASYSIGETMGLGFNLGGQWPGFGAGDPDIFYSAVLGISHGEKTSSFYEIYGWNLFTTEKSDLRLDTGITYLLFPNFQLDLSAGLGISEISPDYFIGAGFSWRIPQ